MITWMSILSSVPQCVTEIHVSDNLKELLHWLQSKHTCTGVPGNSKYICLGFSRTLFAHSLIFNNPHILCTFCVFSLYFLSLLYSFHILLYMLCSHSCTLSICVLHTFIVTVDYQLQALHCCTAHALLQMISVKYKNYFVFALVICILQPSDE